ncbi:hypothetical protein B0J14DRAFT_604707 [Halenospora varia]|nr:hypothetical protein B0J14DRAFT_604707 [Halenospora varia]
MNHHQPHYGHYVQSTPPSAYQMYPNVARSVVPPQERLGPLQERSMQEFEYALNGQDPTWQSSAASSINSMINYGPVSHHPTLASNGEIAGTRHPSSNQPMPRPLPQALLAQVGLPTGPLSAPPDHTTYSAQTIQEAPQGPQCAWPGSSAASAHSESRSVRQRLQEPAREPAPATPPSEDNFPQLKLRYFATPSKPRNNQNLTQLYRIKSFIKTEVAGKINDLRANQEMAAEQLHRVREDVPLVIEASERRVTMSVRDVESNMREWQRDLTKRMVACGKDTTKVQEILNSLQVGIEDDDDDDDEIKEREKEKLKRRKRGGK